MRLDEYLKIENCPDQTLVKLVSNQGWDEYLEEASYQNYRKANIITATYYDLTHGLFAAIAKFAVVTERITDKDRIIILVDEDRNALNRTMEFIRSSASISDVNMLQYS